MARRRDVAPAAEPLVGRPFTPADVDEIRSIISTWRDPSWSPLPFPHPSLERLEQVYVRAGRSRRFKLWEMDERPIDIDRALAEELEC